MLDVYADFAENFMAMPVIKGEKTKGERFPGAEKTLTIEAMMQDRKALQSGTSHFLGQNFSRAQEIKFQSKEGREEFAWTTSWGLSTRMVGALIMSHGDDDGLVLPPKLAPKQIVLLPIYKNDEERSKVLEFCNSLLEELKSIRYHDEKLRVAMDDRDIAGGQKKWQHVKRGVPIRLEIGPRDIDKNSLFVGRRDQPKSSGMDRAEFISKLPEILDEIQAGLYQRALTMREENTRPIDSLDEFKAYFTAKNAKKPEIHGGFAVCHFVDEPEIDKILKPLKVSPRCIPLDQEEEPGTCLFTGKPTTTKAIFGKSY